MDFGHKFFTLSRLKIWAKDIIKDIFATPPPTPVKFILHTSLPLFINKFIKILFQCNGKMADKKSTNKTCRPNKRIKHE